MSRRLDIGICAYRDATKLAKAVDHLRRNSVTDWALLIVDNPGEGSGTRPYIERLLAEEPRVSAKFMESNVGYAGAVNEILRWGSTPMIAYLDHDSYVQTPGWDEKLCALLEENPDCGWAFPGPGHYGFHNGTYNECLWSAGYCWAIKTAAVEDVVLRRP